MNKWETQHSLALSMQISYQAMNLRLGHCAITNQSKGSAALVGIFFSMFRVHGFVSSKKCQKLKFIFWS